MLNPTDAASPWHIPGSWIHSPAIAGGYKKKSLTIGSITIFISMTNNTESYFEFGSFETSGPSYWIHHLEFLYFQFTFVIEEFKNPWVPRFIQIKSLMSWFAILDSPLCISEFMLGLIISDPKNPPVQSFIWKK